MHFFLISSKFEFPKVVQKHRYGVVENSTHLCSKFHELSSNKNLKNQLRYEKVTEFKGGKFF